MDKRYANRVNVIFSNIRPGWTLILRDHNSEEWYEVLERRTPREFSCRNTLKLRNLKTNEITIFDRDEYLTYATCETHGIGYRKKTFMNMAQSANQVSVAVKPTVVTRTPAVPPVVTTPVVTPVQEKSSVNSKFSDLGKNMQKELEEIYTLFQVGKEDEAIDRLLN